MTAPATTPPNPSSSAAPMLVNSPVPMPRPTATALPVEPDAVTV
jgi:hypothetical protein